MSSGLFFPIVALFIVLIIFIVFFFKKHLNTTETKLYSFLIITNFFGLIIEICCSFASIIYGQYPVISNFIFKLYLVLLITWDFIFAIYVLIITNEGNQQYVQKFKKGTKKLIFSLIYWIMVIALFALPISLVVEDNFKVRYTTGPSVNLCYFISIILITVIVLYTIVHYKKLQYKKYIPLFAFAILGSVGGLIQYLYPGMLLITSIQSYIILIMYFTIENPDIKVVEELNKNRNIIEKSIEDKSNLLFEISQDVRLPINKIKDLSSSMIYEKSIEKLHDEANVINEEAKQLSLMVNNVLDVSGMDLKNMKMYSNTYNPYSLFTTLEKKFKDGLNEKVSFNHAIASSLPKELYGDSIRIKQIVNSILQNAINNTEAGYIEFKVNCINKYDICRLMITIADTGKGMHIEKINELLNDDSNLTKEEIKKLDGIDLNIKTVNKFVKELGGFLLIKSQERKGTEVLIVLDQKIKGIDEANNLQLMVSKYLNNKKVVIVSNESSLLSKIKRIINGYDVVTTMYGNDLLQRLENKQEFDLIILDDEMKPDSGYATLINLKKIKGFKTPVIVLLDKDKESIKEHYLNDGFIDYILISNLNEEIKKIDKYI